MAEELNKPAAPVPAVQPKAPETAPGNGDMANLIGNIGILIDGAVVSLQGIFGFIGTTTGQLIEGVNTTVNSSQFKEMVENVGQATTQLADGVNSTINSVQVKEIIENVSNATGQIVEGVTATINSDQIQSSVQELGRFWTNILQNIDNSGQVKNMFDNVSAGLGQLMGSILPAGIQMGSKAETVKKEVKEIPFSPKEQAKPAVAIPPAYTGKRP
ncbi:MAG: chlorosome envelope protein H [Candidatus Chlorobium antarcticum]|jgi:chlorosome envelope protein H|nr:chlorosome envelope protein H [Candidatus Chlorobium antarcticum]